MTILAGYALGKSQRILKNVDPSIGKIFVHGAIDSLTKLLRKQHLELPPTIYVTSEMKKKDFEGRIGPLSAIGYWFVMVAKV